jgi:hypothetical protein
LKLLSYVSNLSRCPHADGTGVRLLANTEGRATALQWPRDGDNLRHGLPEVRLRKRVRCA